MEDGLITGISTGSVIGMIYLVWKMFKHSSCRSKCCGKEASMSVDLEKGESKRSPVSSVKPVVQVESALPTK